MDSLRGDRSRTHDPLTRRGFLAGAAAFALGRAGVRAAGEILSVEADSSTKSTVVEVKSERVLRGPTLDPQTLREMLAAGLAQLTGEAEESAAWAKLLAPNDVIGLKFNRTGARVLGTTPVMLETIVESLVDAGWPASQLVPLEVPEPLYDQLGVARPREGWSSDSVDIGGIRDRLASVLDQVTAIINVPFVKTHNLAGMTCCLKNLSHALVKHPAQFHDHGCIKIAEINALPQIREKLRLNVANGLRIVFDRGPEAEIDFTSSANRILLGTDPVAVDSVALELLNQIRRSQGLPPIGGGGDYPDYLRESARIALGRLDLHEIDWRKVSM